MDATAQYAKFAEQEGMATASARQVMHQYKGQFQQPDLADPTPCHDIAPEEPNVFPDGSVTTPLHPDLGLGGAGIWWPGRCILDAPLQPDEESSAVHNITQQGVELWVPLFGPFVASTKD